MAWIRFSANRKLIGLPVALVLPGVAKNSPENYRGIGVVAQTSANMTNHSIISSYSLYSDWLEKNHTREIFDPNAYRQKPGLDRHFLSYASVPSTPMLLEEAIGAQQLMYQLPLNEQEDNYRTYLHKVLTARFINTSDTNMNFVNVISLGSDCFPRTLFAKWGIRKTRLLGENTLPFDLALSQSLGTLRLIIEGFECLTRKDLIQIAPGTNLAVNTTFGMCFNHEVGEDWYENEYQKLIDRYDNRVGNLRNILANGLPTIAVMNFTNKFDSHSKAILSKSAHALAAQTKGRLRFLCVTTGDCDDDLKRTNSEIISENCTLTRIHIRSPERNYEFYDANLYTSPKGLEYELKFLGAIRDVMIIETGFGFSLGTAAPPKEEIDLDSRQLNSVA